MTFNKLPASGNPYQGNFVGDTTFTVGAEAANAINVAVQLKTENGNDLYARGGVFGWLSNEAPGDEIAASAPSGGWAIGTDGLLIPVVTNKAAYFVSEADGDLDVTITDSGTGAWYLHLLMPDGTIKTSGVIQFA